MTDTLTPEKREAAQRGVELLTRDRDCMVECNSHMTKDGDEFKPVPGTLDPDCKDDFRDYNAAIEAIPALLSALDAAIERAEKAEAELAITKREHHGAMTEMQREYRRAEKAESELTALRARAEKAEKELASIERRLTNPDAVHVNMLRGVIAKPSVAQIKHVYQGEIVNDEEVDALRARVVELEEIINDVLGNVAKRLTTALKENSHDKG